MTNTFNTRRVLGIVSTALLSVLYVPMSIFAFLTGGMSGEGLIGREVPTVVRILQGAAEVFGYLTPVVSLAGIVLSIVFAVRGKRSASVVFKLLGLMCFVLVLALVLILDAIALR